MNTRKGEITLVALLIGSLLAGLFGFGAAKLEKVSKRVNELETQNILLEKALQDEPAQSANLGGFTPSGGITYRLRTSIGTTDTSINLSSFKNRSDIPLTMSVLNTDIGYGTLSPQTSRSEFISFTGITQNSNGTAQLTGVTRGLSDIYPFAASTTLREAHPGQSIFILSDVPQLFEEYTLKRSTQHITGAWGFQGTAPTSTTCATASELCNKAYVDATANQGAATSTELNGGIVELGTISEAASASSSVEIALSNKPRVIQTKDASSTPISVGPNGKHYVVITQASSTIHSDFLDRTASSSFIGGVLINSASIDASTTITSTMTGTTTIANNLNVKAASSTDEKMWWNGVGLSVNSQPLSTFSASNTVPTLNANGNITFLSPEGGLLGEKTTSGATTSVVGFDASTTRRTMRIDIFIPSFSSAGRIGLRFNHDGENNYGYAVTDQGRNLADFGDGLSSLMLFTGSNGTNFSGGTTSPLSISLYIPNNTSGNRKLVQWVTAGSSAGAIPPALFEGAGVWNNTTNQIYSVEVYACGPTAVGAEHCPASSSITFGTGARMTVYGSRP